MCRVVSVIALGHLKREDKLQVQLTIARGGVEAVSPEVLVDVLWRGLAEDPVDGLPLGETLQHRHLAALQLPHQPHRVHRAEEAAGAARPCRPEGLQQTVAHQTLETKL